MTDGRSVDLPALRIGQGFDVHPWSDDPARPLVLGGVVLPDEVGLVGHSDADVIAHACTDALLGGAGAGDIGQLFPDTDPANAGADSLALLAHAVSVVTAAGWVPLNIDCTVVLDRPKIAPIRAEMERNLSAVVGAPVTIKGKRTEGMPSLGEGPHCWAVALLANADPPATEGGGDPAMPTSTPAGPESD
ncbi:MAG: 2-C-methyl-D-erythritol 2,4-cyclodiphosphate synthase [Actinomycetota bacterium]